MPHTTPATTTRWKVDEKHIDHVLNFALANPDDIEDATGMTEQEIECAVATLRSQHNAHAAMVEALGGYQRMTDKVLAIEVMSQREFEQLKTCLQFVLPATQAALRLAKGG